MSNATSIGLPGVGTIRDGIALASPSPNVLRSPGQAQQAWSRGGGDPSTTYMSASSSKKAAANTSQQSWNPPSPFSPAQRMQDTTVSGGSATLIKNGQTLISSNNYELTQGSGMNSAVKARIAAAQRQIGYMTPQRSDALAGTSKTATTGHDDELQGSFLTMSKSNAAKDVYLQYMQ